MTMMKTSARNQFAGRISQVDACPVTTEVVLTLGGGQQITATLTSHSAKSLNLAVGAEAVALIKASAIVLVTDFGGYRLSARNQLAGTIAKVDKGAVTTVVALALAGGETVTATITNDAADALGLAVGRPATAVFKAYSVLLAVKAS
ncbi:molybdopterin-binding protein [Pelomonas sp. KK5]|uniref:TOBE domain-containing protein n=1 Tax=Pelomonas sp. KK5 TaxID=1855730 RepID=UPI001E41B047|nr:TOBE domain-containing protein [Pelomonas sp. KK5]